MYAKLPLITKKAIATHAASALNLLEEETKSDNKDCEEVEYLPLLWDADEDVPVEDWVKLFDESYDSDFEGL